MYITCILHLFIYLLIYLCMLCIYVFIWYAGSALRPQQALAPAFIPWEARIPSGLYQVLRASDKKEKVKEANL